MVEDTRTPAGPLRPVSQSRYLQRIFGVLAVAVLPVLAACTFTSSPDDGIDYKSATVRPPLDVPPDLVNPARTDRGGLLGSATDTTLSEYERERQARTGSLQASGVLPRVPVARIEREGRERWLVVDEPPEAVWPVVREFWLDHGFRIHTESPKPGIIETDWAENRAKIPTDFIRNTLGRVLDTLYSTGERDRFRTRLDRVDGGTEITISHRGMEEVYSDALNEQTRWQPRPTDPDLEVEFLRRLMLRFGADEEEARLQAEAARGETKRAVAELVGSGTNAQLQVNESFERAWRRVGLALDRGGFAVEDRDRSAGIYFVRYIDPVLEQKRPGFFARVFGGADDLAPTQRYRIVFARGEAQTDVGVRLADGEPVPEPLGETAERMLRVLEEQLND